MRFALTRVTRRRTNNKDKQLWFLLFHHTFISVRSVFRCHRMLFFRHLIAFDSAVLQKDSVECEHQGFQRVRSSQWLQLAFPNHDAVPPHCRQLAAHLAISFLISSYFFYPELRVGFRYSIISAPLVPMPKAAVDEDASAVFPHHDVGLARKAGMIQPIAVSMAPQPLAHNHFWPGVLTVNGGHVRMTLLWAKCITHGLSAIRY